VLVAAAGAGWETAALDLIERDGLSVRKRCVDLQDLVASASTGLARVAVASAELRGLDADTVATVRRSGVGLVVVHDPAAVPEERLRRIGADELVGDDLDGLLAAVRRAGGPRSDHGDGGREGLQDGPRGTGHTTVVFGPSGAPGRTTVAAGFAAELAHRGTGTFLVDADPYGGSVAQHLGILDEVSGLLAAARLANAGQLDITRLAGLARTVGADFRVLTGLPRPDRWSEVRAAAFDELLACAADLDPRVVVDVGFSIEGSPGDPFESAPQRNSMTLTALERADDVVLVGAADPVGLARLARALVDLQEVLPDVAVHVVVNRARATLGWSEAEVREMVAGFVHPAGITSIPDDRVTADRALMTGSSLVELGDTPLRAGVAALLDSMLGQGPGEPPRRRRWRRQLPNSR
jgi:MinD-like ATPase involved in chromosome partitioning or flagellar assembly